MLIAQANPNPIPYQYGYPQRQSPALMFNFQPRGYLGDDPFYNTRGEAGATYDNQLGRPGVFGRLRARMGLRDVPAAATTDDVIALMNAHQDRVFALTVVSTTAVAVSALLTVFRTLKLIRAGG